MEMISGAAVDGAVNAWLDEWNGRRGESRDVSVHRFSHRDYVIGYRHITDDLIRMFVLGNGDTNPLFRYEDYGKKSPWGGIIAPPLMITSVSATGMLPDFPPVKGMGLMAAGSHFIMERPLRPGDVIDAKDQWLGITEHTKEDRPHRTFVMHTDRLFYDQRGSLVGTLKARIMCTMPKSNPPAPAEGVKKKPKPKIVRPSYTEEQLNDYYANYDDELEGRLRRGDEPRFWESVKVGDQLGRLVKGPLDIMEVSSFVGICGAPLGFADKWRFIKEELGHSPRDPETNAYQFNMAWHLDDKVAQAMGQPYAIQFGVLTEINMSHLLSNWGGDHSFVREIDSKISSPMYLGETMIVTGEITKVYEKDNRGLVEVTLKAVAQDDRPLAQQRAVIQLPHNGNPNEVVGQVATV